MGVRKNEAAWIDSRKRWQIKVQIDGERRMFTNSASGKKGKIAAERAADRWIEDRLSGESIRTEKMLDKWYEKLKMSTSKAHYRQQDSYIRTWIKPEIGSKRIGNLTKNDIQGVIDNAYHKGRLSDKTLRNIRACLMSFLAYCRDDNVTKFHPDTLKIPAGAIKSSKSILRPKDLEKLFSITTTIYKGEQIEDPYIYAYRFAVLTGIRPGELIGLTKRAINGRKITILQSINDDGEFTQGKNRNAKRTYKIGALAEQVLDDQSAYLKNSGKISKYIFPGPDLDHLGQDLFREEWKRYCSANNFSTQLTPYELRHTFVSVNDEMPDGLKKKILGHSVNMDTEGVYGHEKDDDWDRAAEYADKAFAKYIKR